MSTNKQLCPICNTPVEPSPRYPQYVCDRCSKTVTDRRGRRVEYHNTGVFGGIEGRYVDTQELYSNQQCYIDGHRCHADEHRFGGIVIELHIDRECV